MGEERAQQNAERQAEIAMQDQEYYESMLMDQARESQRKEAEAEERQQAEELKRKQEEEAEREAEIAFAAKKSRVDQPEPDKSHPDRCQIRIRTPSGKQLNRTFLGSDEISLIYDWIDVACAQDDFVKERYQLVTSGMPGKPKRELPKSQQSFKDEGIEHQS